MAAAREDLAASLQELRELAQGIHPAVLEQPRPRVALESLACAPRCTCTWPSASRAGCRPVEVAAYYLVSEALRNVAKYARPRTRASRSRATTGS